MQGEVCADGFVVVERVEGRGMTGSGGEGRER